MRQQIVLGILLLVTGCGSSKETAKKELDKNNITLDPPAGTYSFNPWVLMRKSDSGLGSGVIKIKTPGASEFSDASSCFSAPYEKPEFDPDCVQLDQSGTLAYYLENSEAKSEEKSAEYKIELETNNVAIEGRNIAGETAEKIELAESKTYCDYDDSQKSLWVFVQTKNTAKFGADKLAYVIFKIKEPADGLTVKIDKDSDYPAGIEIKSTNDADPGLFESPGSYSTSRPILADESWLEGACDVQVDSAERAKVTKGKLSCTGLGPDRSDAKPEEYPLGKFLDLSMSWQCDSYK